MAGTTTNGESSVPICVKWGKETFELSLDPSKGVVGIKTELEERTGVPADRMKLMAKSKGLWKGVLKDDFDLTSLDYPAALKKSSPLQVLLMGSATKLVGPKTKTVFIEDLPEEEVAKHAPEPSGLVNLGNTCYLNSVVQCLRGVKYLRNALSSYPPPGGGGGGGGSNPSSPNPLLTSLRDLYNNLDRTANAVPPAQFVMATKMTFPQFAQTGPQGQPMQQDAEEFYSGVLTTCAASMSGKDAIAKGFAYTPPDEALGGASNVIDAVFGLKMEETLTCDELGGGGTEGEGDGEGKEEQVEPPVKSQDLLRKLVCNIQGGAEQALSSADGGKAAPPVNVNYIQEGINLSLNGKIEKRSEVLGRDAVWTRTQRIARLPPVLTVQFGRFYWKLTPDSQDHAGVKCKVMKPVTFQSTLDIYEFCTEKVQKALKVHRDKALAEEEDRIAKKLKATADELAGEKGDEEKKKESGDAMDTSTDGGGAGGEAPAAAAAAGDAMAVDDDDEDAALQAALKMSMEEQPPPVGPGLPDNFQGIYELFAVVTHKGRDADGGHYMGWVKADMVGGEQAASAGEEDWFVFDDDEVSPCKTEDVLKLKGGGDWHMSYLNFYRAKASGVPEKIEGEPADDKKMSS